VLEQVVHVLALVAAAGLERLVLDLDRSEEGTILAHSAERS
jgi:hypothetical protein